jgi:hypothetical protein
MRTHDGGLRIRDDDRDQPQRNAGREPEPEPRGRGETEVGGSEPRPGAQEDEQAKREGAVLGRREDADLLRGELVQLTERDRENAACDDYGEVRDDEGRGGADEDRPEAPTRRGGRDRPWV